MIRIGVVGCGRIGQMHAANVSRHARCRLAAVSDLDHALAAQVARERGAAHASIKEMLHSKDVDAVIVASPTQTHADYIEQAVAAGKPVLCEKPIDLDLERVSRCAEAIRGSQVPVQIGFNRRFDPGHRAVRDAIRAGEIGEVYQVLITSRDPGLPPRNYRETSGGMFLDMTIHDFDLARFLLDGEEPTEVLAIGDALIDPGQAAELDDIDTAAVLLRTPSGRQVVINNSRLAAYGYDQRVEVNGAKGMLISGNRRPHEVRRYTSSASEISEPYLHFFAERYSESFSAEITSFADCIENGSAPEVDLLDGLRATILAVAAQRSLSDRRAVPISDYI